MPRYTLKAILVVVTVVGLWLSSMTIPGGYDLRRLIILLIVVSSVSATYCSTGRRRAFWLSFALVMLSMATSIFRPNPEWPVPNFNWANAIKQGPFNNSETVYFISESIRTVGTLTIAMVAGFIGDFIYGQTRKSDDT
jgi:hypothetical protein